jgi:hypothetical protein
MQYGFNAKTQRGQPQPNTRFEQEATEETERWTMSSDALFCKDAESQGQEANLAPWPTPTIWWVGLPRANSSLRLRVLALKFFCPTAWPWPGPPFVSVQATDPLASEPGNNPGSFTISARAHQCGPDRGLFPRRHRDQWGGLRRHPDQHHPGGGAGFHQHHRHAHQRTGVHRLQNGHLTLPREKL